MHVTSTVSLEASRVSTWGGGGGGARPAAMAATAAAAALSCAAMPS